MSPLQRGGEPTRLRVWKQHSPSVWRFILNRSYNCRAAVSVESEQQHVPGCAHHGGTLLETPDCMSVQASAAASASIMGSFRQGCTTVAPNTSRTEQPPDAHSSPPLCLSVRPQLNSIQPLVFMGSFAGWRSFK